jgi:putative hemolysin
MQTLLEPARLLVSAPKLYATHLARDPAEVRAAQVLRYRIFNLELAEGLAESAATGRDEDPFDAICDHLIVEHLPTQEVVGTYRLQTGMMA